MKTARFSTLAFLLLALCTTALLASPVNWKRAQQPYPGIRYVSISTNKPRTLKYSIIQVDLTIPGLRFTSTEAVPDKIYGQPMPDAPGQFIRTKRESTPKYMIRNRALPMPNSNGRGYNMLVAANATPWTPWPPPKGNVFANPAGLVISEGIVVADNPNTFNAIFVVRKDGSIRIEQSVPREDYPDIWMALSGFGIILKDGKPVDGGGYEKDLMPRLSYGLSKDNRYLYIMAIDGRQPGVSEGTKDNETAKLLLEAGAWNGIDMDGGGSATLCFWDARNRKPKVLSSTGPSQYCREVGMNMGLIVLPQQPQQ